MKTLLKLFRKRPLNAIAGLCVLGLLLIAVVAPYIAPHHPFAMDFTNVLSSPSRQYLFGTDMLGRDILSRILHGTRISIMVGFVAMAVAATFGVTLGVISGYFGKTADLFIMRVIDIMLAIPAILLALLIISILGPEIRNVIIAVGISSIPQFARVVRADTLSVKEREFITAARAMGRGSFKIIGRHILPNIVPSITVLATLRVAAGVLNAAALSFIGLGAQPPSPEWGAMLYEARGYMRDAWWFVVFPGAFIATLVLCVNIIGDGLRDVLDPRLRG